MNPQSQYSFLGEIKKEIKYHGFKENSKGVVERGRRMENEK